MRVLFLGAGAAMAKPALDYLRKSQKIEHLVLSDLKVESIPDIVLDSGNLVERKAVDVSNREELLTAMSGIDMVINTTGPYYLLAETIVRACIDASCHYVDICDDWEPTQALLRLKDEAIRKDITILLGAGISPGVSNLLAVSAAKALDRVDELYTLWSFAPDEVGLAELETIADSDKVSAAVVHFVQQISGKIFTWENSQAQLEKPLTEIPIYFPEKKSGTAYSVGHPEALTLPRVFPGLRRSANAIVEVDRPTGLIIKALSKLVNLKLLSIDVAAKCFSWLAKMDYKHQAKRARENATKPSGEAYFPTVFAVAKGTSNGQATTVAAATRSLPAGAMAEITGVPLAIFAELMLEGVIIQRGVITPEETGAETRFFDALAKVCKQPFACAEDLLLVTEERKGSL